MRRLTIAAVLFGFCLVAAPAKSEVFLKHKIKENSSATTDVHTTTNQTLTIAGMEVKTKANTTMTMVSKIGERDASGDIRVTTSTNAIQSQISLPGGIEYNFDSTNPEQPAPIPQLEALNQIFRATMATQIVTVIDEDNHVTAVEGLDKALEKLDEKTAELVADQFDKDYLIERGNNEFDRIPRNALSVGDTWVLTDEIRVEGGQTLTFDIVYKYLGEVEQDGRKLHKIEIKSKSIEYAMSESSPSPAKLKSSDLKTESPVGYMLFDAELGRVVKSEHEVHVTGDMIFVINGQELPAKLDLTMNFATTIKPE